MSQVKRFVELLGYVHQDSTQLNHFARYRGSAERSTMPITSFVYEFFLYNTIYSINWIETINNRNIIYYTRKTSEGAQQKALELYMYNLSIKDPSKIYNSFAPLTKLSLKGEWTRVIPDSRIKIADGERFFNNINQISQDVVMYNESKICRLNDTFSVIGKCRDYVYMVRNNIFHGTKHLAEIWDDSQRKRIEVYHGFLNCLVSSFFNLTGNGDIIK